MYNRFLLVTFFTILTVSVSAQTITNRLATAFKKFENDAQLRSAISSLYVIEATTGRVVFDKNSRIGLAPASTLKTTTSITAYDLLGRDFRYATEFGYFGKIEDSVLNGSFYIKPSGDPTLGSWRWNQTKEDVVLKRILLAIQNTGIKRYSSVVVDGNGWEGEVIPGGWTWEDIGNYYGAGADMINWRENQYDLILQSGKNIGDAVTVKGTNPTLYGYAITSFATSAAKGTGDRAYIYFPVSSSVGVVRGTIPIEENNFTISGAMPSGKNQFVATLMDSLSQLGVRNFLTPITVDSYRKTDIKSGDISIFHREQSPLLDSIIYLFMKRSINLYGEALLKTLAGLTGKTATTGNGVEAIKDHWKKKLPAISISELNIYDGSGLSPLNRITTHAQVDLLKYAKKQSWFTGFYNSFPDINNIKMKSGSINGVRAFCGYHTAANGKQYIFSFIVNNYNGPASSLLPKMYKVLDVLK